MRIMPGALEDVQEKVVKIKKCLGMLISEGTIQDETKRLEVLLNATPYKDIHAADVLYHKRCYGRHIYKKLKRNVEEESKTVAELIISQFLTINNSSSICLRFLFFERRVIMF